MSINLEKYSGLSEDNIKLEKNEQKNILTDFKLDLIWICNQYESFVFFTQTMCQAHITFYDFLFFSIQNKAIAIKF